MWSSFPISAEFWHFINYPSMFFFLTGKSTGKAHWHPPSRRQNVDFHLGIVSVALHISNHLRKKNRFGGWTSQKCSFFWRENHGRRIYMIINGYMIIMVDVLKIALFDDHMAKEGDCQNQKTCRLIFCKFHNMCWPCVDHVLTPNQVLLESQKVAPSKQTSGRLLVEPRLQSHILGCRSCNASLGKQLETTCGKFFLNKMVAQKREAHYFHH